MGVLIVLGRRAEVLHLVVKFTHVIWHSVVILANYHRLVVSAVAT